MLRKEIYDGIFSASGCGATVVSAQKVLYRETMRPGGEAENRDLE